MLFHNISFYCISEQVNAALTTHKNITKSKLLNSSVNDKINMLKKIKRLLITENPKSQKSI